jgi:hypothetical protein
LNIGAIGMTHGSTLYKSIALSVGGSLVSGAGWKATLLVSHEGQWRSTICLRCCHARSSVQKQEYSCLPCRAARYHIVAKEATPVSLRWTIGVTNWTEKSMANLFIPDPRWKRWQLIPTHSVMMDLAEAELIQGGNLGCCEETRN